MSSSPAFLALALLTLTSPTRAEIYGCTLEAGCYVQRNENGAIEGVTFRKGDVIDTEAGWLPSPDDGWQKMKSGMSNGMMGPGGNVTSLPATAAEVSDGSCWMWGGTTVRARITDPRWGEPTDVTVGVTDPSGNSPKVPGSGGPTSTPDNPTADDSDVITAPGGAKYRVEGGKLQRWNPRSGQWVTGKLLKDPQSSGGAVH